MKKILLMSILCTVTLAGFAPGNKVLYIAKEAQISPYEPLWEATSWVESSNNDRALNRKEMAFGRVQIRKVRLDDYYKRTGKRYKLTDCYNPEISKEIWIYYATQFSPYDYEHISKSWNGRGKSNRIYWSKIEKRLKSRK